MVVSPPSIRVPSVLPSARLTVEEEMGWLRRRLAQLEEEERRKVENEQRKREQEEEDRRLHME